MLPNRATHHIFVRNIFNPFYGPHGTYGLGYGVCACVWGGGGG